MAGLRESGIPDIFQARKDIIAIAAFPSWNDPLATAKQMMLLSDACHRAVKQKIAVHYAPALRGRADEFLAAPTNFFVELRNVRWTTRALARATAIASVVDVDTKAKSPHAH